MKGLFLNSQITRTQFDECVGEFLAVDGDATQQVDELVVGQEVIQQHPVVHLVFTLRHTHTHTETEFTTNIKLLQCLKSKT